MFLASMIRRVLARQTFLFCHEDEINYISKDIRLPDELVILFIFTIIETSSFPWTPIRQRPAWKVVYSGIVNMVHPAFSAEIDRGCCVVEPISAR
jgi:hypothetical protein